MKSKAAGRDSISTVISIIVLLCVGSIIIIIIIIIITIIIVIILIISPRPGNTALMYIRGTVSSNGERDPL